MAIAAIAAIVAIAANEKCVHGANGVLAHDHEWVLDDLSLVYAEILIVMNIPKT